MMMELSAQDICNWFQSHIDKSVLIEKEEQQDKDRIDLQVREVRYLNQNDTVDDYIPNQALILRGVGTIQNQKGEQQRLPDDYYEIPLDGNIQGVRKESGIEIQTERAHYVIELK
jgi:hypothetical protein